ncbi:MAG: hypothetical protein QOJ35_347 [Solirubrobacteraceae bacterium]|jgi:hypothetical protein|nr:hypothetical protein [Solirubrobacteraceae bacterium]
MSAVPGKPHKQQPQEVTLKDGRKLKLRLPGLPPRDEPAKTEDRGGAAPREDAAPPDERSHDAS